MAATGSLGVLLQPEAVKIATAGIKNKTLRIGIMGHPFYFCDGFIMPFLHENMLWHL